MARMSASYVFIQNGLFVTALVTLVLYTLRPAGRITFSPTHTLELKGLAILAILFAHIGYVLLSDDRFLYPLSTLGGVGVDLFLFLSGFGLASSALRREGSLASFYVRRVTSLFPALWIALAVTFIADWILLGSQYSVAYIAQSFVGYFPQADVWTDIDSPLWYITLILFLYIIFPIVWSKRRPWLSAICVAMAAYVLAYFAPFIFPDVAHLYSLHTYAFSLGVLGAWLASRYEQQLLRARDSLRGIMRIAALCIIFAGVLYFAVNSAVGTPFEQYGNLAIAGFIVLFFAIKTSHSSFLIVLGMYSYEIYLIHWPLLSRYDVLYENVPFAVATLLYLGIFLVLGYVLHSAVTRMRPYAMTLLSKVI